MRNVKVAAIQPGSLPMPDACNWQHHGYCGDAERLIGEYLSGKMAVTFDLLEQAGREGCDIVTSCEDSGGVGFYMADVSASAGAENQDAFFAESMFTELVERTAPLLEVRFSEIAARYGMYVIGCYFKRIEGRNCNIATIFDRTGRSVGQYHKTHLPPDETWQSVPGDAIETFDLDFGRIGLCICYDMMFPEPVHILSLKGAEIIFHPTFGYGWYDGIGEATLRTRANDGSLYIVTSKNAVFNSAGKSGIVDPWGHVVAQAGFEENVVVTKVIDLDRKKTQPDWHNPTRMSGTADVHLRMSRERRPELYTELCEPVPEPFQAPGHERQLEIRQEIMDGRCRWS